MRSNWADYVLLLLIYFIFYSPFVLRNYSTGFRKISRKCVFWCSLNNPVVLKLFWCHHAEINAKKNLLKISRVDSDFDYNFKTVKDNSNLKQTWTRGIVSLHFWRILFWTIGGQLRSICSIGWENLFFLSDCYILVAHSKTIPLICTKLPGKLCTLWSRLDNLGD